jgi:hypothetical protein
MSEAMIDEVAIGEAVIDVDEIAGAMIDMEEIDAMVTGDQKKMVEEAADSEAEEVTSVGATPVAGGPMTDVAHLTEERHGAGAEAEASLQHAKSTSDRRWRSCSAGRTASTPKQASS